MGNEVSSVPAPAGHLHSGQPGQWARSARTVRSLRVALALTWLLDGGLQLQPFMFTKGFVDDVLVPSTQGNPGFVARPTLAVAHLIEPHIALWNTLFAAVQVAIGAGLLISSLARRGGLLRLALGGSFLWAAAVWWLSEGLGGVLTGASPLSGAPGAVVLYVVAGALLWPGRATTDDPVPAPVLGTAVARATWLGLWALCALLMLEPGNQAPGAVSSVLSSAAAGEPAGLRGLLSGAGRDLAGTGPWLDSLLALVMLLVGAGVALRVRPRAALAAAIVLSVAIWVFGEAFGGVLTGQGTDPNSGPLWVLLAACMWAGLPPSPQLARRRQLRFEALKAGRGTQAAQA